MSKDHYEIEVKVLEVNKKELENKLKEIGAKKKAKRKIKTILYGVPGKENKNVIIRLRKKPGVFSITYKKVLKTNKPVKIAEEIGVKVPDFNEMKLILDRLFIKKIEYEKEGILYIKEGTIFGIDTIKGIPTFLEIEAESIKTIEKYIKILKIDKKKIRKWTAEQLLKNYKFV